jgi:hypothetical protein
MSADLESTPDHPVPTSRLGRALLLLAIVLGGSLIAYSTTKIMEMSIRYFAAVLLGAVFLSLSMVFVRWLTDVLLHLMVFCIPLFTFEKWTFAARDDSWVDFGMVGFNIGLLDIFLLGLYAAWAIEVVVLRIRSAPRLKLLDWLVLAFVGANVLSLISSASRTFTIFEIFRVGKYALAYFYVAHRLERRHLKGIVLAFLVAVVFESALGVYQFRTQKLAGIARSRGMVNDELETQYEVPGFEGHKRAEGTTIDSHALGVYFDLLLPFALCLALAPWIPALVRWPCGLVFCIGVPGLVATFSRGGWGGFIIEVAFIFMVFALLWREHRVLRVLVVLALLVLPIVPFGGSGLMGKKLFRTPWEVVSVRWDTVLTGYEIWKQNIYTGRGANAYLHAQRDVGRIYELSNDKPAHNTFVYVMAQLGIVGLLTYYTLGIVVLVKCLTLMRWRDPLLSPLALAVAAGFIATQADGFVDFMSFTNQDYFMQFLNCGLVAGMLTMRGPQPAQQFVHLNDWHVPPPEE